ncbi:unnamed protein product [Schistosoma mattheei]|uniref:Uncharacterized protein n=1 Tax=Schistosoma mattheei TaxID=31246 RepID=A0A3P8BDM9_9TREM|nr:unnamed protein product [Schistosoma mattheei]
MFQKPRINTKFVKVMSARKNANIIHCFKRFNTYCALFIVRSYFPISRMQGFDRYTCNSFFRQFRKSSGNSFLAV